MSILEELGLSKGEVKVYLALLELDISKVGTLIEKTEMASSAVHNALLTLSNKGLISHVKKGQIKLYQAAPPKYIGNFAEQRLEKFNELLPELEEKQRKNNEKQEAEVFIGFKGITTMLNLLIEDSKKGETYMFFASMSPEDRNKEIQAFYEKYDFKRKEKGLFVRGLATLKLKPYFQDRNKVLHVKYTSFPIPKNISIVNDKVTIISWSDKPVGFLIRSKQIADSYRDLFEEIWDKYAKK